MQNIKIKEDLQLEKQRVGIPLTKTNLQEEKQRVSFPLTKTNFILMGIDGAIIVLGFLLMLGGSSTEEAFNPDIYSPRRIVVGPTIAFLGFIFMGFGIIYRSKKERENDK